jgi:hypothetical protein
MLPNGVMIVTKKGKKKEKAWCNITLALLGTADKETLPKYQNKCRQVTVLITMVRGYFGFLWQH